MIASYSWLTLVKINEVSGVKLDLASGVSPIQNPAPLVLEVDRSFDGTKEGLLDSKPHVLETALSVRGGSTCVVEGEATLSNWDTSLEIDVHALRPLSPAEGEDQFYKDNSVEVGGQRFYDQYQRNIWDWNSSRGKEVHFRRRFRNELPARSGRLALRVWNNSKSPTKGLIRIYAQCSRPK
jgi:hypothetical protein